MLALLREQLQLISNRRFWSGSRSFFGNSSHFGRSFLNRCFWGGSSSSFGRRRSSGFGSFTLRIFGVGQLLRLIFGAFLGLLAGFARLGVVSRCAFDDASLVKHARDAVGGLRANADPIAHAVFGQADTVCVVLGEERVIGADLLKIGAIARATAVCDNNLVIRALFRATAREAKRN